jgi:formylglycine-generating enzyme
MARRALGLVLALSGIFLVAAAVREADIELAPVDDAPRASPAAASPVAVAAATETRHSVTVPAPVAPADAPVAQAGACPAEMVHVQGDYCTDVRHTCKKWLDDPKLPFARCGEYEPAARCVGKRVKMGYCIDRHEYTPPGDSVPANFQSFVSVSKLCKAQGKRICTESEWNFACEGEEMRPYPYGWSRESKCNQDRMDLFTENPRQRELADRRLPSASLDQCVSPFGVYDMVGNLDEPVLREEARFAYPYRNGLKGGWWMPGRNRCRPATTKHDDHYNDIQVGARCCADLPGAEAGAKG